MKQSDVYEEFSIEAVNSAPQEDLLPAVIFEKVGKSFPGASAEPLVLEDISLTVGVGEFICLVGASGCGKSTLLNLVAGLEEPSTGTISRPGGKVALLFQDAALLPWLTAGENVELALRLRGVKRVERRSEAERLLTLVHLKGLHSSPIHELSGGMRQRVALARALAQEPRILLMDEPFGALDAITRDVLHEELIRIWRATGLTIIFVTHNVREAVRLGQRVKLMGSRPGRVIGDWKVDISGERRIESPAVAELAIEITDELRREIRSHASERQ